MKSARKLYKIIKVSRWVILLCIIFGICTPELTADNPAIKTVVAGNNEFALDLYGKLKDREGNIFFSPYSISTALAMTYAGARENTEKQMAGTLHFQTDQAELHGAFSVIEKQLNTAQKKGGINLHVANALWMQKGYTFLGSFADLVRNNYSAALEEVDFSRAPEAVCAKINAWVEEKTNDKIRDLIKPGLLGDLTRLVLTNAIYFKGNWARQFKKDLTKEAPFRPAPGKPVNVPMMTQEGEFGYSESKDLQILEMPYAGDDLSMVILLPKAVDGTVKLEKDLNGNNLNNWLAGLMKRDVLVYLPRFRTTSEFNLEKVLASMGMPDAFDKLADFSGIDGTKSLLISAVLHKAFVDVNEEGTEAAAATAVVMEIKSAMPVQPAVFKADRPFIFLIRHNPSGSILFIGRVTDPTKGLSKKSFPQKRESS